MCLSFLPAVILPALRQLRQLPLTHRHIKVFSKLLGDRAIAPQKPCMTCQWMLGYKRTQDQIFVKKLLAFGGSTLSLNKSPLDFILTNCWILCEVGRLLCNFWAHNPAVFILIFFLLDRFKFYSLAPRYFNRIDCFHIRKHSYKGNKKTLKWNHCIRHITCQVITIYGSTWSNYCSSKRHHLGYFGYEQNHCVDGWIKKKCDWNHVLYTMDLTTIRYWYCFCWSQISLWPREQLDWWLEGQVLAISRDNTLDWCHRSCYFIRQAHVPHIFCSTRPLRFI